MNNRKFLRSNLRTELKSGEGRGLKRSLRKAGAKVSYFNCVALMLGDYDAIQYPRP